jgi:hypothetical protein
MFVGLITAGCGLVDADITDFDLSLPEKSFTVDTSTWGLDSSAAAVLSTPCTVGGGVCELAAATACPDGQCTAECNASTLTCDLTIAFDLWTPIDLATEKPELATIDDQSLVDVTIDTISYRVGENSLDVATPPITLSVAPANIMDAETGSAVGTIAAIPAMTTVGLTQVNITGDGRAALIDAMQDFRTPFNIIIGAEIVVRNGDTIPTGRMVAGVAVTAHAGL